MTGVDQITVQQVIEPDRRRADAADHHRRGGPGEFHARRTEPSEYQTGSNIRLNTAPNVISTPGTVALPLARMMLPATIVVVKSTTLG